MSVTSMKVISSGKVFVNEFRNMLTEHGTSRGCYTYICGSEHNNTQDWVLVCL